jgi:hypothetical protein
MGTFSKDASDASEGSEGKEGCSDRFVYDACFIQTSLNKTKYSPPSGPTSIERYHDSCKTSPLNVFTL